jgi:hydrogenase maturation protein HypF
MNSDNLAPSVNKGSIYCGAFLPYTPLQTMLTEQLGPLIMTSANQSDQPMIREDDEILSLQSDYLDGILYNQRRIVRSVDDSVARVIDQKPQLIRRSRGYVPYPVFINNPKDITIFAAGGDLKAAFCLYREGKAVVSQYFGDLEENMVMENYRQSFTDLSRLLLIKPTLAVCDLHPNYHSAQFAKTLDIPLIKVQHHHAHVASVIAEHDLRERVIGVAFDGTGYGTDGNIWGGEFLICEGAEFIRAGQLRYMPILGGDRSMKDAKKTASCYLLNMGLDSFILDDRRDIIKAALKTNVNTVLTSSMGRLFDAASSILDICQENRYEGECAVSFEREAALALKNRIKPEKLDFAIIENSEIIELDPKPVFNALVSLRKTKSKGALALGFHYALAEATADVCERLRDRYTSNVVALSGGVFQNAILTERTLMLLRQRGFETYVNLSVPPNDGAISLGQAYLGLLTKQNLK